MARQDWADGTVHYQVEVDLRGDASMSVRVYQWPQPPPARRALADSSPVGAELRGHQLLGQAMLAEASSLPVRSA
ncbi:hypothetical protein ABTZ58_33690 [Streptomyces sp. NPDC094143]|uniref:hypothetical protein n=1 Tax=Streptomyces sp. NPDC094143 TaxID=3155310 RepID=UPI00332D5895